MVRFRIAVDITQIIRPRTLKVITDRGMGNPYRTVFIFHRISISSIMQGMIVTPYKTKAIIAGDSLEEILTSSLPTLEERAIVVITSKIVSICEGNLVKIDGTVDKAELIRKESEYYIEDEKLTQWGLTLTIKRNLLIANAGVDESNGNGNFVLWPKNVQRTTNSIWHRLRKKHKLKDLGVIITDSRLTPLRWGTLGVGLSWCGFTALNDYIGKQDIFGRTCKLTKSSIIDGIAVAAVLTMGEGNEQTPLALVTQVPFVRFMDRPPSMKELKDMQISKEEDIYSPLTNSSKWQKGG